MAEYGELELVDRGIDQMVHIDPGSQIVDLENEVLLGGRWTPVEKTDDHEAHLSGHISAMGSDDFGESTGQGRMLLYQHIGQHLMAQSGGEPVTVSQRREV